MKTTVRNLRIREDTAKYLRNLDPNSAYYDPKTRSMRDNPNPSANPEVPTTAPIASITLTSCVARTFHMQEITSQESQATQWSLQEPLCSLGRPPNALRRVLR